MLHCKLRLFVVRITTYVRNQFHVAKSRNSVYFSSATWKFVLRVGVNTGNKQSQLAMQHLLRDKMQENVARITLPLRKVLTLLGLDLVVALSGAQALE